MQRNEKIGICCPNSSFSLNLWHSPTRMMHWRSKLIFLLVLSSKQHYLSLMWWRQKSLKCACRDALLLSCKAQISVQKTYSDWPLPSPWNWQTEIVPNMNNISTISTELLPLWDSWPGQNLYENAWGIVKETSLFYCNRNMNAIVIEISLFYCNRNKNAWAIVIDVILPL